MRFCSHAIINPENEEDDILGLGQKKVLMKPFIPSKISSVKLLVIWSSCHLVVWSSGHLVIWSSGHLVIWLSWSAGQLVSWSAGHPVIQSSHHPVILSSCHPVIPPVILSSHHPVMPSSCHLVYLFYIYIQFVPCSSRLNKYTMIFFKNSFIFSFVNDVMEIIVSYNSYIHRA